MRNILLIDKKLVPCSFLKNCSAATVERNLMYFASQDDLCKLDLDLTDAENNASQISTYSFSMKLLFIQDTHFAIAG